ncbi:hypothetical protein T4A_12990 [Trichinella pseudospiralis]|uniref:Uncharacterized protein n=1 Tax=Trichinella pseudospiralis TaxID=6337 RepID=A0A0V1EGJ2_TRIPS|nr:hypothetical protein T4A_12990 [Trichinella pseudospiralis]
MNRLQEENIKKGKLCEKKPPEDEANSAVQNLLRSSNEYLLMYHNFVLIIVWIRHMICNAIEVFKMKINTFKTVTKEKSTM